MTDLSDHPVLSRVSAIVAAHAATPGPLLPVLHAVQEALGHIPGDAVPLIAQRLNLSRAEVHGVITYYHFFRTQPPGAHVVQVCRAESCQACGGEALWTHAHKSLGCHGEHHASTSADGVVTLESVYCLGLCAQSPAIAIDGTMHAHMTPAAFDAAIADAKAKAPAGAKA